jgi:acyl-CoA thioesterase-1
MVVAAWLTACGSPEKQLPLLADDAVLLAFGDSLTHGTGAGRSESYPAILQRLVHRRVINAGVPGELSAAGAQRLPRLLDEVHPDLLILCHGGNDILRNNSATQTKRNLERMIEVARQRQIPVVLIGVPEKTLLLHTAPLYAELADELSVPLETEALAEILQDRDLKSDPIHPNGKGYRKLAEAMYSLLERAGAVE